MAYVARDRKTEGIFESLSILANFSLPTILRDGKFFVRERRRRRRFASYIERLGIKLAAAGYRITTLSGGNQQKVVLARWLATEPRVIVLNDPTRGVDLRTKSDVYELLAELAASGVAIVLLSTEVEELLALTDRVLVFREDSITAELERHEITRSALIAAYFGELQSDEKRGKIETS
jgi:ABC-type sugar transport system ATPase subunit